MKSNDELKKLGLFFFQINNENFDHFTFNFLKGEDTLIYSSDQRLWSKFKQILIKNNEYQGIIFSDGEVLNKQINKNKFYFDFLTKSEYDDYKDLSVFNFLRQRFLTRTNSEYLKEKISIERKFLQEKHFNFELAFFEQQNYSKLLNLILEKLEKEFEDQKMSESDFLYNLKKIWILIWQFKSSYYKYYQDKLDNLSKLEKPYLNFISKLDKNVVALNSVIDIYYLEHYKRKNQEKQSNSQKQPIFVKTNSFFSYFLKKKLKKNKGFNGNKSIFYLLKKLLKNDIKEATKDFKIKKDKLIKIFIILNKKFLRLWKRKFIFASKNSYDSVLFYDYWFGWLHMNFAKIVDDVNSDKSYWVKKFFNLHFKATSFKYKDIFSNLFNKIFEYKNKRKEIYYSKKEVLEQKEEIRKKFEDSRTYWTYLNSLYEQKSAQNWIQNSIIKNNKLHRTIKEENKAKLKQIYKIIFDFLSQNSSNFADFEATNSFFKITFESIQNKDIKSSLKNEKLDYKSFFNFILEKEIISFCEKNNLNHGVLFKKYKDLNQEQKVNLELAISEWFNFDFYFLNSDELYFEPNFFIDNFLKTKKQNQSLIIFSSKFLKPQFLNFLFIEKNKIIESLLNTNYKPIFSTTFANYFFKHHNFDLDLLKELPTKKYNEFYYQNVEFNGFNNIKNVWEDWSDKVKSEKEEEILHLETTLENAIYPVGENDFVVNDIKIERPKLDLNLKEDNGK